MTTVSALIKITILEKIEAFGECRVSRHNMADAFPPPPDKTIDEMMTLVMDTVIDDTPITDPNVLASVLPPSAEAQLKTFCIEYDLEHTIDFVTMNSVFRKLR